MVERRQLFRNTSQIFGVDGDPGQNLTEQPYIPIVRGASGSSSIIRHTDNMTIQGRRLHSQWIPVPRSSKYSSSFLNDELPYYQSMASGPSRYPYLHQSAAGNQHMVQDYLPLPSYSNIGGHTIAGVDVGSYDPTISNRRGQLKRKSPSIPPMRDLGPTSRYCDVGSSSDVHFPADRWQEKQNNKPYYAHWDYPPNYRGNSLSIGGDGMVRNVRSRAGVDPGTNPPRTHLPSSSLHHTYTSRSSDRSNGLDFWRQGTNAPMEWNSHFIYPPAHAVTSGSDSCCFNHGLNSLNPPNSHISRSIVAGSYTNHTTLNTNCGPQNVNNPLNRSFRGVQGGYSDRSTQTFRSSCSNFHRGYAASSGGQQMVVGSNPSRHQRAISNLRLRNVNSNGRYSMSGSRYSSYTEQPSFHDQFTPEGLVGVNHSDLYGSRVLLDQHLDMALDIDNMSYEELLALGERIGSVNTGLSDDLISKCLAKSTYCSPDTFQKEGTCIICLEEYQNKEEVGTLKACGHGFHVGCIKKWLSMKNICPICKASAMDDTMKQK